MSYIRRHYVMPSCNAPSLMKEHGRGGQLRAIKGRLHRSGLSDNALKMSSTVGDMAHVVMS